MSSSEFRASGKSSARLSVTAASLLCATALAGCSADLARLDMANLGFSDSPAHGNAPIPSEPMRRGFVNPSPEPAEPAEPYSYTPRPYQAPGSRVEPIRRAGLPEPVSSSPPPPVSVAAPPRPVLAQHDTAPASGRVVEVVPGDTLYGIAKRHGVSISELMSANGLQGPTIYPGQKLALPTDGRRRPPSHRSEVASRSHRALPSPAPVAAEPRETAVEPSDDWSGSYTVSPRDSLYAIARRHNVRVAELQSVNGISDPARLRPGTVLKVPGSDSAPTPRRSMEPPATSSGPVPPAVAHEAQTELTPGISARPRIINAERESLQPPPDRVAVAAPTAPVLNDASPTAEPAQPKSTAFAGKFRWPARGRIIAGFGRRPDHTHNDGINILVPQGSSVLAAEGGTVAYAGNELKGYGNLILIRHEGNWISAYAHNDSLLVRRGDTVERGQEIAKAGKTGAVDQPQLHFELRQGSKPVDPLPYLDR